MTPDFFPGFEEYEAERKQQSHQSYGARMLLKLLTSLNKEQAKQYQLELREDFNFQWFNESMNPPLMFQAQKLRKTGYETFFKKQLYKTELGKAFFELMDDYGKAGHDVGLIFPMAGLSNWIIYSGSLVPIAAGVSFVERRSDVEDAPPIRIMRFDDFIHGFRNCYAL